MKNLLPALAASALIICALTACQTPKAKTSHEGGLDRGIRNNCYSLLHELLEQEKHLGLLRFIKREETDVKQLVKKIAATSTEGAELLKEFAAQDDSISLDDTWLPPGELATREAIAATTREELLHQSGSEFELTLLLAQSKALSYGKHLADIAGQKDTRPERIQALARLSQQLEELYQEVFQLLLSRNK